MPHRHRCDVQLDCPSVTQWDVVINFAIEVRFWRSPLAAQPLLSRLLSLQGVVATHDSQNSVIVLIGAPTWLLTLCRLGLFHSSVAPRTLRAPADGRVQSTSFPGSSGVAGCFQRDTFPRKCASGPLAALKIVLSPVQLWQESVLSSPFVPPFVFLSSGWRRIDLCPLGLVGNTANIVCPADPLGSSAAQTLRLVPCVTTPAVAPRDRCPLGR